MFLLQKVKSSSMARWTNWAAYSSTVVHSQTLSVCASWRCPKSASDPATSPGNFASPTAASPRSSPATTRPARSCRAPSAVQNPASPPPKSSPTSRSWSRRIRVYSRGRYGTNSCPTVFVINIMCRQWVRSVGYWGIRLDRWCIRRRIRIRCTIRSIRVIRIRISKSCNRRRRRRRRRIRDRRRHIVGPVRIRLPIFWLECMRLLSG